MTRSVDVRPCCCLVYHRRDREGSPVRLLRKGNDMDLVHRTGVFDAGDLRRALTRIAHEIVERNRGADDVVLVGLYRPAASPSPSASPSAIAEFEGVERARRRARRRLLPRRHRAAPGRCPRPPPRSPSTSPVARSCWSTTCSSPAAPSAPPSTRWASSAGPRASSWRCWSTAATASCPIRPDYVGKNLPTAATRWCDRRATTASWIGRAGGPRSAPTDEPREAPPLDRRPRRASDRRGCSTLAEPFVEVDQRRDPEGPDAARATVVASLFFEDSTRTRLSFETAAKRLSADVMTSRRRVVVGEEGRVLRDTVADPRGHGRRRGRHPPPARRGAAARWHRLDPTARSSTPATAGTSTPPRRCSTCSRCAGAAGRSLDGLRVAIVGDVRHSRVARCDVTAYTALGARGHAGRAADPAARVARGLAGRGRLRPRRRPRRARRGHAPAPAARAEQRALFVPRCASTPRATA